MGAARRMSPAPWNRPGAPRVSGRPSWIGMPRAVVPAGSGPQSSPTPRMPSNRPSAGEGASMAPPSVSPVLAPLTRASLPPASSPIIQSGRELALESEAHALREEIARLAVELASVRARVLEETEPEIVRLAMTVASRVVGRELTADPSLVLDWIHEGFAALPGRDEVVVAVAPDVAGLISRDSAASAALEGRKLVVDPALRPGSCELREGARVVAVGSAERLAAISDALGVDKER